MNRTTSRFSYANAGYEHGGKLDKFAEQLLMHSYALIHLALGAPGRAWWESCGQLAIFL
jgi:hypothetical protein